jgi:TMEM175 potassium channel family protein
VGQSPPNVYHIRRCDNLLLALNLLLLLGVTFVPFPTSVLAGHLRRPDQRTAAALFNGTYLAIAILFNLLWRYAARGRRRLLSSDVDTAAAEQITRQYSVGPLLYLLCLALVWVNVFASLLANLFLACFFAFPPDRIRPAEKR